jgi:hypothetical protein
VKNRCLPAINLVCSVTGLGEVSLLGRLFSLGDYLRSIANSMATFSCIFMYILILTYDVLGYTLGDFFTNSSGHPEHL